jgi:predicted nucleotidyltransferase
MFTIKQNDTSPAIRAALKTPNNQAVNLIGATVRFHMKDDLDTIIVDKPAVVENQEGGIVRYDWETGDTNAEGICFCEFEVTYEDESIETFPNNGYIKIKITKEIS